MAVIQPASTGDQHQAPDREAMRAALAQTRSEFRALVRAVPAAAWRRKSGNAAWSIGELLWHLAFSLRFAADGVAGARRGKAFNPPAFLADRLNTLATHVGAWRATPASVARTYDANYRRLLAALDGVNENEWTLGVTSFGSYQTIEDLFRSVPKHFAEHSADIRAAM